MKKMILKELKKDLTQNQSLKVNKYNKFYFKGQLKQLSSKNQDDDPDKSNNPLN